MTGAIDGVFQNLLGRTVVVEDLDCGHRHGPASTGNRFRIVTLDGQVINRGGSMTGGSVSRSAGVLSPCQRAGAAEQVSWSSCVGSWRTPTAGPQETGRELQKAQYELDVAQAQQRAAAQDRC